MAADRETVELAMGEVRKLIRDFAVERYLCLAAAVLAFGITLYAAYRMIGPDTPDSRTMVTLFGSGGILTAALAQISRYFSRAFTLLEFLMRSMVGGRTGND